MKKFSLTMLLAACSAIMYADPIDLARAKQLASDYLKTKGEPVLVSNAKRSKAKLRKTAGEDTPPYYVFSRGENAGFVIVAGDDILPEIIGYTEQGEWDDSTMPEGLRYYLYGYEQAVEKYRDYVEKNGSQANAEIKSRGLQSKLRKAAGTRDLGPLMTSAWGQGWPYNNLCPTDPQTNALSVTGCVATSTSSVIHYWRKDNPRYSMTDAPAYWVYTRGYWWDPAVPAGHAMKWELMKDSYGGGMHDDYYTSVAELLRIVGAQVNMDYTSSSSGAQSSKQPDALNCFNLNGTNTWYSWHNNMDNWEAMIISDLEQGRPILYSGYTESWAGHAFVVDGYRLSDGYYHFDFGWNGGWNGYYSLSDANGFNVDQSMTYQIYPRHLNLSAEISAPTFSANTNNTVTVTVQNNGTLDYTSGINLFCSTSSSQPTSWENYQVNWTTIPKGGSDVSLTFTVNPGNGSAWYLMVVDKDMHVLKRVKVPYTTVKEDVTSTYLTNPSFEQYNSNSVPTGWTLGNGGQYSRDAENDTWRAVGHDGTKVLDSWVAGDTGYGISQTLTGLPEGYYCLTAKVATDVGKTVTVFAGDNSVTTGAHEFGKYYLQDVTIDKIQVGSNGSLTIGIQPGSWYKADDFRLYRYTVDPTGVSTVKNAAEGNDYYDITNAYTPWLSTEVFGDWTNNGFAVGTWGAYSGNDGAALNAPFFEKWVAAGNYLDDASIQQTITGLPNGTYYIGGSFIATSQGIGGADVEGVTFWAGNQSVSLGTAPKTPEIYSLKVTVTDGTLTYGLKTECSTANWVAVDNLFLYWAGDETSYLGLGTSTAPVRIPLANPRMESSLAGWTLTENAWQSQTSSYANFNQPFMESWVASTGALADMSATQDVLLNAGHYKFSAAVNATRQGNSSLSVSGVNLKFGDSSVSCHTGDGQPQVFETPWTTFTGGKATLGLYVASTNANWVAWDNAVLYYYSDENAQNTYYVHFAEGAPASASYTVNNLTKVSDNVYSTKLTIMTENVDQYVTAGQVSEYTTSISVSGNIITITYTPAPVYTIAEDTPPSGAQSLANGTYYLRNRASGTYLCAGHDWGTQASLGTEGLDFKLTHVGNGRYTIDSQVSNGGDYHYLAVPGSVGAVPYLDSGAFNYALTDLGNGYYAISYQNYSQTFGGISYYLGYSAANPSLLASNLDDVNEAAAQWQLLTRDQLVALLQEDCTAASETSPVDVTNYLYGANFGRNDQRVSSSWSGGPALGGSATNMCAEKYNTSFDVYQNVTGLLPGKYRVTAQAFYRCGTRDNAYSAWTAGTETLDAVLYATATGSSQETPIMSIFEEVGKDGYPTGADGWWTASSSVVIPDNMTTASNVFSAGFCVNEVDVVVADDGVLRLGVKKTKANDPDGNWTIFDNFRLYYLGNPGNDAYHQALSNCQEAASIYESSTAGAAIAALSQYTWTDEEYAAKSAEEIQNAIKVLNNGVAISRNAQSATALVANAGFNETANGNGAPAGWTLVSNISGDGADGSQIWYDNGVFNAWAENITELSLYQTVANLPNGTYKLSAQLGTDTNDGAVSKVAIYANPDWDHVGRSEEVNVYNNWDDRSFGNYSCYVEVTDNDVQVGVRSDARFYQMKNITLTFVTDAAEAARETDASYLRQDYYWNGTNAYEFDASSGKFAHAKNVVVYPAADKRNQLIRAAAADQFANTSNKVVNGECANLVITDGYSFQNSSSFTADEASYTRSFSADWATIQLPYAIEANTDVKLYELVSVSNVNSSDGIMVFTSVSSLDGGKPGVIHVNSPVDYTFTVRNADVVATTDEAVVSPISGWNLVGAYTPLELDLTAAGAPACYYIANNKFYRATGSLTVNPFRAYFRAPSTGLLPTSFGITTESEATGISGLEGTGAALNVFVDKGSLHLVANERTTYTIVTVNGMAVAKGTLQVGEEQTLQLVPGVYIVNGQKILLK